MHVYFYTPSADGGHAKYTNELVSALCTLKPLGGRFEVITSVNLHEKYRSSKYNFHAILPEQKHRSTYASVFGWAFSRLAYYLKRESTLLRFLRQSGGRAGIHFQEFTPWLAPYYFKKFKKLEFKLYYTVHNIRPHKYPPLVSPRLYTAMQRKAWSLCDVLFVHTDGLKMQLEEFLGANHPPIYVTPHGVWSLPPSPKKSTPRLANKQLLFFGTIRANKGLHHLLRAMRYLDGYSLTIAGPPSDLGYYQNVVKPLIEDLVSLNISVNVYDEFIPEEKVADFFEASSMLVLPYENFEAQSGVLYLALAHEIPIAATAAGGVGEILDKYGVGCTISSLEPQTLAQSIDNFIVNVDEKLVKERLALAKSSSSWKVAALQLKKAYEDNWKCNG